MAAIVAVSLLLPAGPASGAPAAPDREVGTAACPADLPDDEFDDVREWSTHEHAIDCVAWWGISVGDTNGQYGPGRAVNRGQIATFLDRTLTTAGTPPPAASTPAYADVPAGHTHAAAIARLAAIDVVRPVGHDRYRPGDALRRDDMAVFLVAAWQHHTGLALPSPTRGFPDLHGHPDRAAIEAAATLGFTTGLSDGTYGPTGTVTRERMASFLTRLLDDLVRDHGLEPPTAPAWGRVPPGRARFLPLPSAPASSYRLFDSFGHTPRWNPCLPVEVAVDLTGAPSGAASAVRTAVGRLRTATGLTLTYREVTGLRPDGLDDFFPMMQPGRLVVVWPRRWEPGPGMAGFGGFVNRNEWIYAGAVALDTSFAPNQEHLTALAMHELGHAVGLDHPDAPGQIMSTAYGLGATWTAGDLAGLARVGRGMGCPPQPFLTYPEMAPWY